MTLEELQQELATYVSGGVSKVILSMPVDKAATCKKVSVRRIPSGYQVERIVGTQAFHQTVQAGELAGLVGGLLGREYRQLNGWSSDIELCVTVAPDGNVRCKRKRIKPSDGKEVEVSHNRMKHRLLVEGEVIPPLVDMGIFTSEGRLVPSMSDKYRQINRFLEFIDDVIGDDYRGKSLRAIDFGCGKSYLTFVMYHYLTVVKGVDARMTGLDLKADVIRSCEKAARTYGYDGLDFQIGDIGKFPVEGSLDMVVTLHACDTATDHALAHAVHGGAKMILSVPCCQHELNGQMHSSELPILCRYGIVKERMAALMTDALRANILTACGYKTQVLEFVDLSHTPKNLLLRAVKSTLPDDVRVRAREEALSLMKAFGFKPTLWDLLELGE